MYKLLIGILLIGTLSGCSTLVGNTVWGIGSHEIKYNKEGEKTEEKHECKSWLAEIFDLSLIKGD